MTGRDGFGHFLEAQEGVYRQVLAELAAGRKSSHWIWFIFPQLAGLGYSATSRRFALDSVAQARAYFRHPVLGQRLLECCALLLDHRQEPAAAILGETDAMKVRSSMTLFRLAAPECPVFDEVLSAFYQGEPDARTLDLLDPG